MIGPRPLRWWLIELRDLGWRRFVRAESAGTARGLAAKVFRHLDGFDDSRELFTAFAREIQTERVDLLRPPPDGVRGWAQPEFRDFPERWFHPESELPGLQPKGAP